MGIPENIFANANDYHQNANVAQATKKAAVQNNVRRQNHGPSSDNPLILNIFILQPAAVRISHALLTPQMRIVIVRSAMENKAIKKPPESSSTSRLPDTDRSMRISSAVLLGDQGELVIEHAGREYRLRVTQNGKLILTA